MNELEQIKADLEQHLGAVAPPAARKESWLTSYLDLTTLLLVLFLAIVAKATFDPYSLMTSQGEIEEGLEPSPITAALQAPSDTSIEAMIELLREEVALLAEELDEEIVVMREGNILTVSIPGGLLFATGEAKLDSTGNTLLARMAPLLAQLGRRIRVEGHTDSDPIYNLKFPSNWELSATRAANVARILDISGVPRDKMEAVGLSDTVPVADNNTAEGKQRNRRVRVAIELDEAAKT